MKKLPRISSVAPVIHGVLKLSFIDGYDGVLDLRPLIAKGRIFTWLQEPVNFEKVRLDEYGHSISWVDDDGYEIDLGADSLRRECQRQADAHKLLVG
jgi:hypothetical protein